jgi:hypothetical protein
MSSNLKKTGDMAVGQIGFHRDRDVKKVFQHLVSLTSLGFQIHLEKKIPEIVKRLEKTRVEVDDYDYQGEREERDQRVRAKEVCKIYFGHFLSDKFKKEAARKRMKAEETERAQREREKEARSYDKVFSKAKIKTNKDMAEGSDDDFM